MGLSTAPSQVHCDGHAIRGLFSQLIRRHDESVKKDSSLETNVRPFLFEQVMQMCEYIPTKKSSPVSSINSDQLRTLTFKIFTSFYLSIGNPRNVPN